jgi:hypothetical protein
MASLFCWAFCGMVLVATIYGVFGNGTFSINSSLILIERGEPELIEYEKYLVTHKLSVQGTEVIAPED